MINKEFLNALSDQEFNDLIEPLLGDKMLSNREFDISDGFLTVNIEPDGFQGLSDSYSIPLWIFDCPNPANEMVKRQLGNELLKLYTRREILQMNIEQLDLQINDVRSKLVEVCQKL